MGWQVAHWIETLLCHGPGDVEGEPITLDQDYLTAIVRAYAVDPKSGRRLIRRYILSRAKGRAKSEFAGMLACAEALGPVRFDHWAARGETSWWGYRFGKGEPVGQSVVRPFIRCLATEELQTGNTYDNVRFILTSEKAPITTEIRGIDAGLTRTFLPRGGEIRPSSAASASKDGGKETFAVLDESHLYVLPELRAMSSTVRRNCTKRAGWSLETTTMFELGAGSTAEETFKAWDEGKLRRADVVFDHHEGPDPETFDWDNDKALLKALAQAYKPATWVDLDARLAEIRDPTTDRADAVRYFLNRASSSASDVVKAEDWAALAVEDRAEPDDTIVAMFDGSDSDDSTAIVGMRGHDGLIFPIGLWENPGVTGWKVPRREVHDRVAWMFKTFRVVLFYGDRRYWETDWDEWAGLYSDDVVLELPQTDRRLWDAASGFTTLVAAALQAPDDEQVFSERICHDGDPDIARHFQNARRRRLGGRLGRDGAWIPDKKKPDRKIDLAACAIGATKARSDAIARGLLSEVADPLSQIW